MPLDNRTLLVSLLLVCALMAMALAIVARGDGRAELRHWVAALSLQALGWLTALLRGSLPDVAVIVTANVLMSTSYAVMLAAIETFCGRPWPRLACLVPPIAAALLCGLLAQNLAARMVVSSFLYAGQFALIAAALLRAPELREGRAPWLLLAATGAALAALLVRGGAALLGGEFATVLSSGPAHPAQLMVFAVALGSSTVGSLGFILMIMERSDREIRNLAMTDSLTQVRNRRAFLADAEREHAVARRNHTPLTLLMIDVDHFKQINDLHGHPAGDEVLTAVARLLADRLRRQDIIGRYGGEEFSIIAPQTDVEGAYQLAESLRAIVENTPLTDRNIRATISIGMDVCPATCDACQPNLPAMLERADAALYEAKRNGRNQAQFSGQPCPSAPLQSLAA